MKIKATFLLLISAWSLFVNADINQDWETKRQNALDKFMKKSDAIHENFNQIRRKANEDFARKMAEPWTPVSLRPLTPLPEYPSPDPITVDMDTVDEIIPQPLVIREIVPVPELQTRPQPIEPILTTQDVTPMVSVKLFGTDFAFRKPDLEGFRLTGSKGEDIANAWIWLSERNADNLISDCLKLRAEKNLCDWAYLQLLKAISKSLTSGDRNKSVLLTGFLFNQSGYKMRFSFNEDRHLYLCYNSTGIVYNNPYLIIDDERYYVDDVSGSGKRYEVCDFSFPGESPLSFEIKEQMKLDYSPSPIHNIEAKFHPEINVSISVNENLIDFYNSYPRATLNRNPKTYWMLYANVPVSSELREQLYPVLEKVITGKTQKDAANMLLHLAESFPYGYDDEIWGDDRPFFMDESWYYSLSDCEDHAINFSRMVRDLLGLDTVLVDYPTHIATAVAFTDGSVDGDYFMLDGKKYIVCDPTIFYSNVGTTMRGMNNSEATLIPLHNSNDEK